jgi:hypothetical protein
MKFSRKIKLLVLLLLIGGCANPVHDNEDYRPTAKDTIYRPLTPLPRHQALAHRPTPRLKQQQPQYTTNYNTTNNYNYGTGPSVTYRPRNDGWRNYQNAYHRECHHVRIPITKRCWQEPVDKPVFGGYDTCGNIFYNQRLISPGSWYTITVGYKCRHCGCRL